MKDKFKGGYYEAAVIYGTIGGFALIVLGGITDVRLFSQIGIIALIPLWIALIIGATYMVLSGIGEIIGIFRK